MSCPRREATVRCNKGQGLNNMRYLQNSRQKILTWQSRGNIIWNGLRVRAAVAVVERKTIDAEVLGKGRKLKREDAVSTFTIIFNTQFRL